MKDADHAEGDAEGLVASAQQIPLVAETGMEMQILRVLLNAGETSPSDLMLCVSVQLE